MTLRVWIDCKTCWKNGVVWVKDRGNGRWLRKLFSAYCASILCVNLRVKSTGFRFLVGVSFATKPRLPKGHFKFQFFWAVKMEIWASNLIFHFYSGKLKIENWIAINQFSFLRRCMTMTCDAWLTGIVPLAPPSAGTPSLCPMDCVSHCCVVIL